jgi:hydroxypyruvate isomerase
MSEISRRNIMKTAAALAVAGAIPASAESTSKPASSARKGNINHSACQWCYKSWEPEQFCINASKLGMHGIDLVGPDWFPTLKKYNLAGTMTRTHSIPKGLNRKENWDECLGLIRTAIDATSEAGFPNVICFSGNRDGMDDETGLKNCAEALKQVVGLAEEKKVTINMELLNSKRSHKDYMCDRSDWGIKLCKAVGSEHFKLLYDIFHMQIDEGDVIDTIKEHHQYFGHYHTGGVPGRHEIDETQELYYPAIMHAIVKTGFKGVVAQEFIPARDPFTSLSQAIDICDV